MKKLCFVVSFLFMQIIMSACTLTGVGTTNNSYANFEIIDQQTTTPGIANEYYVAGFSTEANNLYSLFTESAYTPGPVIALGGATVSLNNGTANSLVSNSWTTPSGFFYSYPSQSGVSVNVPNYNSYKFQFNYQGSGYSAVLANFPTIYTISSATCTPSGSNLSCSVETSNFVGTLPKATVIYKITGTNPSTCYAIPNFSTITVDTVIFNNCGIAGGSTPTISMQIGYSSIPLSSVVNGNTTLFNMRGQYYFITTGISATIN